jgi:hypothetical protein
MLSGSDSRGNAFFDDDDLAERARWTGFELAVARDLFAHHFGSRTIVRNGIDAGKLIDENVVRFTEKWGLARTAGRRVALRPFVAPGSPVLAVAGDRAVDLSHTNPKRQRGTPGFGANVEAFPSLAFRVSGSHDMATEIDLLSPVSSDSTPDLARVSLTTIVRDEEHNLTHRLESCAGCLMRSSLSTPAAGPDC